MSALKQPLHSPQRRTQTVTKQVRVYKGGITYGEKILYLGSILILAALCFFVISNAAAVYSLNHEGQVLETSITEQQSANDALALQVTELSDPDRILTIAEQDLGMSLDSAQVQVLYGSN
ncbi:cell division protein FtsL [Alkalicoccus chagannorensis]|uniref:cell division protein FtsL n=1 Tax=Alkalicoccus chagannorensis TaxID=427072 RepID=UPI0003FE27C4|nr:cell division protein FtsL [Alkalicoccus chagannorensis]